MKKILFSIIAILGIIVIIILSFIIPNNPYQIIPAYTLITLDKPLWLDIVISCSFIYIIILYSIYKKIKIFN